MTTALPVKPSSVCCTYKWVMGSSTCIRINITRLDNMTFACILTVCPHKHEDYNYFTNIQRYELDKEESKLRHFKIALMLLYSCWLQITEIALGINFKSQDVWIGASAGDQKAAYWWGYFLAPILPFDWIGRLPLKVIIPASYLLPWKS